MAGRSFRRARRNEGGRLRAGAPVKHKDMLDGEAERFAAYAKEDR
jgi:hypothetical protein